MKKLFGVLLIAALPLTMVPSVAQAHPTAKKAKVSITSFMYTPSPLSIKVGTRVIWTNNSQASHSTTSDDGTSWDSKGLIAGAKFKHKFMTVGTFTYHCMFHPFMTGEVDVTP